MNGKYIFYAVTFFSVTAILVSFWLVMSVRGALQTSSPECNQERASNTCHKTYKVAFALPIVRDVNESSPLTFGYIDGAGVVATMIHEVMEKNTHVDYELIALVLPHVQRARPTLEKLGWTILEKPLPYNYEDLKNPKYRDDLMKDGEEFSWGGIWELLKLEIFTMTDYDRVVMMEPDMMIFRDISHLFDIDKTIMYTKGTVTGEFMNGAPFIIKPNVTMYEEMWELVVEGDFRDGTGWKGSGYGWCYGGRAAQGLIPYYMYMVMDPDKRLQIDRCVYNNQVSGWCDPNPGGLCYEFGCWNTPLPAIYMMHYSLCQKPWTCFRNDNPNHDLCRYFTDVWWNTTRKIEQRFNVQERPRCTDGYQTIDIYPHPPVRVVW